jgi:hypothetical protein
MTIKYCALVGALLLGTAAAAGAHHGQAGLFEQNRIIELKGTVKRWSFTNPHPILILQAPNEKGAQVDWDVYFGPGAVASLRRQGFSTETFKEGETLTVKGYPATNGAPGLDVQGKGAGITRADGRTAP